MKKRVTILTAAGLTAGPDFARITTTGLTQNLREHKIDNLEISGMLPGEYLYRKLCLHYTGKRKNDCDISIVNFETIIHMLEEMYSYLSSYIYGNKDINPGFKGVKPSFLRLQETISKDLHAVRHFSDKEKLYQLVRFIYVRFINCIIQGLKSFNDDENNLGMRSFGDDFLNQHLKSKEWIRRIYTTNYDTWINSYMGFYDGFNSDGRFEGEKVLLDDNYDCHYNIHGCVLWKNELGENRISKLKKLESVLNSTMSSDYGINREPLLSTPIITGYNKSARMKYDPYLHFYYSLQRDILKSDLLLIIGYSFSDTHINNLLELHKGKTVCVGYIPKWFDAEEKMNEFVNNKKKRVSYIRKYGDFDPNDVPYDRFNPELLRMFESIRPLNMGFDFKSSQIRDGWISSLNHKTIFWWRGIGPDFYSKWTQLTG